MERLTIWIDFDEDSDPVTIENVKLRAKLFCEQLEDYKERGVRPHAQYETTNNGFRDAQAPEAQTTDSG